jgi:glycerol-3-phosphate dehydrogenase
VKGSHLIVNRLYEGEQAFLLQSPDRRVIFTIPFETNYTLIGTTDIPFDGDPAQISISPDERDYLLKCAARFFRHPPSSADIVASYSGVRPLYDDGSESAAQRVSRDYKLELQHTAFGAPILSVYGGKITTYRRLAEAALQQLLPGNAATTHGSWTATRPLPGGNFAAGDLDTFTAHSRERWPWLDADLASRMARSYGTRMAQLLGDARAMGDLGRHFGAGLTAAELKYLVHEEWARSAEDILWRRTRLGLRFPASAVHNLQDAVTQLL